jgi:glucokinase
MKNEESEACTVNVSPLHGDIAEAYISIRWFLKRYQQLSGQPAKEVKQLAEAAKHDVWAAQVFREFTVNLAIVLKQFIAEEQPDLVVIGGGIANAYDLFYPALGELLQDAIGHTVIKRSLLGETAAIAGAACCWKSAIDTLPEQNNQQTTNRYL